MHNLNKIAARFLRSEEGPTAVEYAVMMALIMVACITAVTTLGGNSNKSFTSAGKGANVSST